MSNWFCVDDLPLDQFIPSSVMLLFFISAVAPLLLWRIWTFSLLPLIDRRRPKQLPYWTPSHAVSFFKNPEGLLSVGRMYFGDSRQPFAVTIAGKTFYILTNKDDVSKAYNNSTTLSFDDLLFDMMRSFGFSSKIVEKMFEIPKNTALSKSVVHSGHDWQVQQTRGKGLTYLDGQTKSYFEEKLQFHKFNQECSCVTKMNEKDVVISLSQWSREMIMNAIQHAYFGEHLNNIDPNLVQMLMRFDKLSWQVFFQVPAILSQQMNREKSKIIATMKNYFQTPVEERQGEAWFTRTLEGTYRSLGFDDEEIASLVFFTYWGINTNVSKAGFWTLAYIVHDSELLQHIRKETDQAFNEKGLDVRRLMKSCPLLDSVWLETLRLTSGLSSIRNITEDTEIGGKVLRRGNRILISARQLHLNDAVFGEEPSRFEPTRFADSPKLQNQSAGYRPFGGGITLCPGRFMAKHTVFIFVALALRRFEIELAMPQPFPRNEEKDVSFGTSMSNDDLLLKLRERQA